MDFLQEWLPEADDEELRHDEDVKNLTSYFAGACGEIHESRIQTAADDDAIREERGGFIS
jgi:hypothetical protein